MNSYKVLMYITVHNIAVLVIIKYNLGTHNYSKTKN